MNDKSFSDTPAGMAEFLGVSEERVELTNAAEELASATGWLVVQVRENEGLSQSDLAEKIGLTSAGRISQFETGQLRHAINLKSLGKVMKVLGYDLAIEAVKSADNQSGRVSVQVKDRNGNVLQRSS